MYMDIDLFGTHIFSLQLQVLSLEPLGCQSAVQNGSGAAQLFNFLPEYSACS